MEKKTALLVMPEAMQEEFGALASAEGIKWMGVESCQEARQALDQGGFLAMVCYETLPDGNWYGLLEQIVLREDETNMIVALPSGSDFSSVTSCGVEVVRYPPGPDFVRKLKEAIESARNGSTVR